MQALKTAFSPVRLRHLSRKSSSSLGVTAIAVGFALGGCSSVNNLLGGDKVDYRSSGTQSVKLDVPPDLTQLSRDSRYQATPGVPVSATGLQQAQPNALNPAVQKEIAAQAIGDLRIAREGNQRWLVTGLTAEAIWPQLKSFWQEQGFALAKEDQAVGVMETEWSENRAKLPAEASSNLVGRLLGSLYDTGERDRYRTRIERSASGTEVYISHRGIEEVYTNARQDQTAWQARASDPSLEGEMLSRLMIKLGAKPEAAKLEVANKSQSLATRARLAAGSTTTVVVDDEFDSAWRRVGLALDRSGFTVEDRDRALGIYYVRYADPAKDRKSEGGFLSRMLGLSSSDNSSLARYRLTVKADGRSTTVAVLNDKGQPETSATTERIAKLLIDELK